jgi:hypothetical protein
MTILNNEALKDRARSYHTIPAELEPARVDALPTACKTTVTSFYKLDDGAFELKSDQPLMSRQHVFKVLECLGVLNGIRMMLVRPEADQAVLETHFFNLNYLESVLLKIAADPSIASRIFPISGGHRILAGSAEDQVRVVSASAPRPNEPVIEFVVKPIGDYSTYTLSINSLDQPGFDPLFGEIPFKFRPACFNNCPPDWQPSEETKLVPTIDYLAKDFHSFRHALIAWMMKRVPDWQPTSEADLDHVLLELFSAAADELSDYQDRVVNEAYLTSARKRVSIARHARLMDYHIHQGNQGSTWLAMQVKDKDTIKQDIVAWAGEEYEDPASVVFASRRRSSIRPHQIEPLEVDPLVNELGLFTWSDAVPALAAGSTSADLEIPGGESDAKAIATLISKGAVPRLLIQEHQNPLTGGSTGRDVTRRQVLRLITDDEDKGPVAREDPATTTWYVRVHWEERDTLKRDYCFTVECPDGSKADNVSLFHGNLVRVFQGRPRIVQFKDPGARQAGQNEYHYERTKRGQAICRLPDRDLAYRPTEPGGEIEPRSTLEITVIDDSVEDPTWSEVSSLVHSDASAERGDHFVVETDEGGKSWIRFGDGINGRKLPDRAELRCRYQVGRGLDGNIGADTVQNIDPKKFLHLQAIEKVWNPFDVVDGRAPEPVEEIIRRAPEAYRARQLRAVTLKDYVNRAQELTGVQKASARYMWTGSWRAVRASIDPVGGLELTEELENTVADHLDAVRLIGDDVELRPPRFVPLDIDMAVCIEDEFWPRDIEFMLEQEFSAGFTPDGRKAFFHPDRWTFGQALRESEIIGRAQSIKGVDHVIEVKMRRWRELTPGTTGAIEVRPNEIVQVRNDPDHMEMGSIRFELRGGRQ